MKDYSQLGYDIIAACRNELYIQMPYLNEALFSLVPVPGDSGIVSAATDGVELRYNGSYLANRYVRSEVAVNRLYLHSILHCMLRHIGRRAGRIPELWDLACDVSAESIIDSLSNTCVKDYVNSTRQTFYGRCRSVMKVITAEAVYAMLLREKLSKNEISILTRTFAADDHILWSGDDRKKDESENSVDKKWKNIASRVQTGFETGFSGKSEDGNAILEQVSISAGDDVDYRAFLRRFAVHREILKSDDDSFDYVFYTYGLERYGNMPLIEPLETKEEKRIEDFVIAIDTSMSTKGEPVRDFLRTTYSVLRSRETFTQKLNIRILQCDDTVRSDTVIHSVAELEEYMENVELKGGSATDFRPVFRHVEALQKSGEFSSLRGLIYFTDGIGVYPEKMPDYEVAFALSSEPPEGIKIPPWCIRLVLSPADYAANSPETDYYDDTPAEMPDL